MSAWVLICLLPLGGAPPSHRATVSPAHVVPAASEPAQETLPDCPFTAILEDDDDGPGEDRAGGDETTSGLLAAHAHLFAVHPGLRSPSGHAFFTPPPRAHLFALRRLLN